MDLGHGINSFRSHFRLRHFLGIILTMVRAFLRDLFRGLWLQKAALTDQRAGGCGRNKYLWVAKRTQEKWVEGEVGMAGKRQ